MYATAPKQQIYSVATSYHSVLTQLNQDVNQFQRNFVNEVKRAEEMERRLRFLDAQVWNVNVDPGEEDGPEIPDATWKINYDDVPHEPTSATQMEELEVHPRVFTVRVHRPNINRLLYSL